MKRLFALLLAGTLACGPVWAAGFETNGIPQAGGSQFPSTLPLTGNEQGAFDTLLSGGASPQTEAISTAQLGSYQNGLPSRNNALIGGDAGTNLWQRGTTGASETTTVTYGGPDRWAYWSGASTAMTVSRSNTAAALPTGYQQTFRMQRTASQTGVVQMCMAQEVESANSYQFAGSTAELDFHAYTGANFSASNYNMTAYIIYGTGSDEGMSDLAYGLNAGGGGSVGWTGQTNATAAVISLGGVSTAGRYSAVATIPSTATEIGVALCYTPVGTAGTTDAIYFAGIQLVRNPANAAYVSSTIGYNDATFPAASFERRSQQTETALQQRYFYSITEPAAHITAANGGAASTSTCLLTVPFPTTMRAAPTFANFGTALSSSTWKLASAGTEYALATTYLVVATANAVSAGSLTATMAASLTAGNSCTLVGAAGGSIITWSAEL